MFGPKRKRSGAEGLAAREKSAVEPTRREAGIGSSPQRDAWRRAAQSVTRAWCEWSAAPDSRRRSELYRRYISALDEEEQAAAELQQVSDDERLPSLSGPHR